MKNQIKTLEQFRATRKIISSEEFNEKYGNLLEPGLKIIGYESSYIFLTDDGHIELVIHNKIYRDKPIDVLEEILWDEHAKYNYLSSTELEEEYHQRVRDFMDEQGWSLLSLDEQDTTIMTPKQLKRTNYLIDIYGNL